jgi:hypothetical protein
MGSCPLGQAMGHFYVSILENSAEQVARYIASELIEDNRWF